MSTAWAAILDSCLSWCHRLHSPAVSELSTAEFRGEEGRPARTRLWAGMIQASLRGKAEQLQQTDSGGRGVGDISLPSFLLPRSPDSLPVGI